MTHYLSVLGIFKNEAHIFAEWIEHYLKEGVEHFFLVDNGSTDTFRERMAPYKDKITLYVRLERHAQVKIYNDILPSVKTLTEWLMPVDFDEFVYARHGTISDYLKTLDPGIGQVQVPWRFFASSTLMKQPDLVIPSFVYRWRTGYDDTIDCKSIARCSSVVSLDIHVHHVAGRTITSDGSAVRHPTFQLRVSDSLHKTSRLICNHYVLQSKEWFFTVKATRGAADIAEHEHVRSQQYWDERDRNEVLDIGLALKRHASEADLSPQAVRMASHIPTTSHRECKYWNTPEEGGAIWAELGFVRDGSRVLEVGTAAGHVTRMLKQKGCEVTGIERDNDLARLAAPACRRMIVGDIEDLDLDAELSEEFDVILCGNVLEHLRNPGAVLQKLKRRLGPTGQLVVSMPNVAHASVRLSLLEGTFAYAEDGLLDATHLRCFTLSSIAELFNRNGFEIRDLYRARVRLFDTEIHVEPSQVSAFAVRQVIQDQEATAYQFVFRAIPSGQPNSLAGLRDPTFDPIRERQHFSAFCMTRAWRAFHEGNVDRSAARAWSWLALVSRPSLKAALYWMRSFCPLRLWRP